MKISNRPYYRSLADQLYIEMLVEKIKKDRLLKAPSTIQEPSTQRTLERDPLDDLRWQSRDLPTNWKARPNAKTLAEAVNKRALDPQEISHVEATRRRPKNSQGMGQASAATEIGRECAISAFVYTPGIKVNEEEIKARAIGLVPYKSEMPVEIPAKPDPWYKSIWSKLTKTTNEPSFTRADYLTRDKNGKVLSDE